jgi:transcriptional regulator with XRE-family HTH domain
MTFAEKLRQLRDGAGLSEARLADAAGLTFASVHGYGLGRRTPSFPAVVKLSRALGVSCEVFDDCDDMSEEEPPAKRSGTDRGKPRSAEEPPTPKKPRGRARKMK